MRRSARSPAPNRAQRQSAQGSPAPQQSAQGHQRSANVPDILHAIHQWANGPGLVVLSTFLQLAPNFVVSSSLLVDGCKDNELAMRKGGTTALLVCLSAEMAWTAYRPGGLPLRTAGWCLLIGVVLNIANIAAAYSASNHVYQSLAFGLQLLPGLCVIPAYRRTANWILGQARSPARWRIVGWILTLSAGTLPLLLRALARVGPALVLSSALPLGIAIALILSSDGASAASSGKAAAVATRPKKKSAGADAAAVAVPLSTACHFIGLVVLLGSNAEAINDVAMIRLQRPSQMPLLLLLAP